jgi:hypothetical protein
MQPLYATCNNCGKYGADCECNRIGTASPEATSFAFNFSEMPSHNWRLRLALLLDEFRKNCPVEKINAE